ncbi:MAG: hypothetical protein RSC68_07985 [Acinetobacter sp.]
MNTFLELFQNKKFPLIMSMPMNDPDVIEAAFIAGADAVKVHVNLLHHASEHHFGSVEEQKEVFDRMFHKRYGPLGIVLGNNTELVSKTASKTLCYPFDFVSLYAHHSPISMMDISASLMLACDTSYSEAELSCFEACNADVLEASVIPSDEYGRALQMRDLMRYRIICKHTTLPVVVPTQCAIQPCELKRLLDTGVRGIMVGAIVTGSTKASIVKAIASFRTTIDRL